MSLDEASWFEWQDGRRKESAVLVISAWTSDCIHPLSPIVFSATNSIWRPTKRSISFSSPDSCSQFHWISSAKEKGGWSDVTTGLWQGLRWSTSCMDCLIIATMWVLPRKNLSSVVGQMTRLATMSWWLAWYVADELFSPGEISCSTTCVCCNYRCSLVSWNRCSCSGMSGL